MSNTINVMNLQIYKFHLEIVEMKGSVREMFFRNKISEFYKNNSLRLNSLLSLLDKIRNKYFETDENRNTKVGEDGLPVFKEGLLKEDYEKEHTELMRTKTVIVVV